MLVGYYTAVPSPIIYKDDFDIGVDGTSSIPTPADLDIGTEDIYLNGFMLREGSSNDYIIDSSDITFQNGLLLYTGDVVIVKYHKV